MIASAPGRLSLRQRLGMDDVSPVTLEGRLIAVVLMLTGIGVIGLFTATVATRFFEQEKESELAAMATRLDAIDQRTLDIRTVLDEAGDLMKAFQTSCSPAPQLRD